MTVFSQTGLASYSSLELAQIVQKQRAEIDRLLKEDKLKNKKLALMERALHNHLSIKRRYNYVRNAYNRLREKHDKCREDLRSKFPRLRDDQIAALRRKSTKGMHWSPQSYRDGLVLRMQCGTSGYLALVKKVPLYPSIRSLQMY